MMESPLDSLKECWSHSTPRPEGWGGQSKRKSPAVDDSGYVTPYLSNDSSYIKDSVLGSPTKRHHDSGLEESLYSEPEEVRVSSWVAKSSSPPGTLQPTELTENIEKLQVWRRKPPRPPCSDRLRPRKPTRTPSALLPRRLPIKPRPMSLLGEDHVDFLYQWGERSNFHHLITKLIGYVSDADLANMANVSKTWRELICQDPVVKRRWLTHIKDLSSRKENMSQGGSRRATPCSPLANRNRNSPAKLRTPSSPPCSPSKVRFRMFQKEAARLRAGESLVHCPRCGRPAVVSLQAARGACVRPACGTVFCTDCKGPSHPGRPCPTTPTSPSSPSARPSPRPSSRRTLRRLLI